MAAWANALVTISGGRAAMPSDGPLRKLVGWIDAGVSRCAGAGGDGRRRPFPTALVLAGGAPLGLPGGAVPETGSPAFLRYSSRRRSILRMV